MDPSATALITGASSGIGRELARALAERGYHLALVARGEQPLAALAHELRDARRRVHVIPCDLVQPGAPASVRAALERLGVEIDVLVNSAGTMELGSFDAQELQALEAMVDLNARALMSMTRLLLPPMRERGRGRILNVASVAAFQALPSLAVYAATKAFVLSLTEALAEELAGTGVTVTAVCPGLTQTRMVEQAKASNALAARLPDLLIANPRDVARDAVAACLAGRVVEVPGLANRALSTGSRIPPRWITRKLTGLVGRRFLRE